MGLFYANVQQGDLLLHPGGCSTFSKDDGVWDFTNQTLTRDIPDMSTSAQLYFALYDSDGIDADDLLGSHFATFSSPSSGSSNNNDQKPAGFAFSSCDGLDIDDDSLPSRFSLSHSWWFTDGSPPAHADIPPAHSDDDSGSGYDNDNSLDFSWPAASDPNTGISAYGYELRKDGVVSQTSSSHDSTELTVTSADGSEYELRVRARNGEVLTIENPAWSTWTPWSDPVVIDATADAIASIAAYTENGGVEIPEGVEQDDNTPYIEWSVPDSTAPIEGYSTGLNTPPDCVIDTVEYSATPGPLPGGTTTFYVRAVDAAGNCGPPASFEIVVLLPDVVLTDGFEDIPGICSIDDDCDSGEHCFENFCTIDVNWGGECAAANQCDDGLQCVDGVCCSAACNGSCEACNLSLDGTCTAIPMGEDPDMECSGFSCSAYFWGWSGDTCYRHADVNDAAAACNGNRSCQSASSACLISGQGSAALSCALDEVPDPATCSGTTTPACLPAPATISGMTWNDLNSNGNINQNENGLAAITVEHFTDANMDGTPDGAALGATLSDESGEFAIEVPAGTYVLRANEAGFCQTTGADSVIDDLTGYSFLITVDAGAIHMNNHIGITSDCAP